MAEKLTSLGEKVLRVRASGTYRPRETDTIINWGNTQIPNWYVWGETPMPMVNQPSNIKDSIDKIIALKKMSEAGVSTVEFTTDKEVAKTWGGTIVARTLTRASQGRGIVHCDIGSIVDAPLYTKYIEKDAEYRVHIFKGECIDYVKKINDTESELGWRFLRGIKRLDENIELAIMAVNALGLDFGAVDIIRKDRKSYVLEVNTACGMDGEITSTAYANAIIKNG